MIINLDGEKPENMSQEFWEQCQRIVKETFDESGAEKEYIDRNDLIKNLKQFEPEHYTPLIDSLIKKQPAADVVEFVEVVRCEDCYYYDRQNDYCNMFDFDPPSDTFYCRDGERKESEVEE